MERYIIFCKPTCPFCVSAVQIMEQHNLNFKQVVFVQDQEALLTEVKEAYEWRTVPMIFKRVENTITFIGGYTDLLDHLEIDE